MLWLLTWKCESVLLQPKEGDVIHALQEAAVEGSLSPSHKAVFHTGSS